MSFAYWVTVGFIFWPFVLLAIILLGHAVDTFIDWYIERHVPTVGKRRR